MKLKEIEKQKIPVTIGGVSMYLRYDLNAYRYLEEYYDGGIHDLMKKQVTEWSMTDAMHLLRAGLIDYNIEKNESALNSGKMDDIVPSMSTLGKILDEEQISVLTGYILVAMIESMPAAPVGEQPNPQKRVQNRKNTKRSGVCTSI